MKVNTDIEPSHVKAADLEDGTIYTYKCYPCPKCGKWLTFNTNHKYCEYCGIKLEWGDTQ